MEAMCRKLGAIIRHIFIAKRQEVAIMHIFGTASFAAALLSPLVFITQYKLFYTCSFCVEHSLWTSLSRTWRYKFWIFHKEYSSTIRRWLPSEACRTNRTIMSTVRWRALLYLNLEKCNSGNQDTFGFNSNRTTPQSLKWLNLRKEWPT
jgi:hypothetical protein